MYSSSTFLLVQKPKNVKTNLMFKLFQITEKRVLILLHVGKKKKGPQSWENHTAFVVSRNHSYKDHGH